MTVYAYEFLKEGSPERRCREAYSSLDRLVRSLEWHQQMRPDIAESLQPRLDGLVLRRDSYANAIKKYDAELGPIINRITRWD